MVTQLYENELFPELQFSRKQSQNSEVEANERESSLEMPKFDESDEERATSQ